MKSQEKKEPFRCNPDECNNIEQEQRATSPPYLSEENRQSAEKYFQYPHLTILQLGCIQEKILLICTFHSVPPLL